ncbi:MAG: L-aspartate oxidase [Bacteroidia bacterium]|nr:L-aspartate oxidase [Bacteroidia bacterium]
MNTDFLVIGSGIAGLTFALKTAQKLPDAAITIITKADESESNTKYAQGGIAVALDTIFDSYQKHIDDTLVCGDGLCNPAVVELVVKEGPERLKEFIEWGASFDRTSSGNYDLGREGGHSVNRILHHKDVTGLEMERTLLAQIHAAKNITVLQHHFAIDLITNHHRPGKVSKWRSYNQCYGVYALNRATGAIEKIISKVTLLATGGAGQVYRNTTNPIIATGDGVAMAHRAKALITNMEFIQFHPTALYNPGESPSFLISEAVRGFGAKLKTKDGQPFMQKYDSREELASRDIVARSIDAELKARGDEFVYIDCRHLDNEKFVAHFPNINKKCLSLGIDITKDMIPVVPAAHYMCGGIDVDEWGRSSIKNLYACGECSNTGLHGANRLASNSLLEALVFGHRCFVDATEQVKESDYITDVPEWNAAGTQVPKERVLITHNHKEVQNLMSDLVAIVRTNQRLNLAMKRLDVIYQETQQLYNNTVLSPQLCELRNIVAVAYLIIKQSSQRRENKGAFFNADLVKV